MMYFLAHSLMVSLALSGGIAGAQTTKPFPDVPKDHWAYQAVMELKQKGILIGYPDGSFNGQGAKVVKPTYDISTPKNTWLSLLKAMRNRDECGLQYVMAKDFEYDNVGMLHPDVKTLKERLDYFQKRVKQWEKWTFYLMDDVNADVTSVRAMLDVHSTFDGFPSPNPLIRFKKTDERWKIDLVLVNLE